MKWILLLFVMMYCHIIDDYILQGCLANLKQKQYWHRTLGPRFDRKYEHDYIVALICHAFSWSMSISLAPLYLYYKSGNEKLLLLILIVIPVYTIIHAIVDNLKANAIVMKINLIVDQLIHLVQIILYWLLIIYLY